MCTPVWITVAGELPDPCYEVVGATVHKPDPIPCMTPMPCPLEIQVEITVREPNPLLGRPCPAVVTPYTRSFSFGRLRAGEYRVTAHERVIPFSADSTDSTVSESFASAAFVVRPDSTCAPGEGCYILSFGPGRPRDELPPYFCDAVAPPGGTACLAVNLMNTTPVGGLQTALEVMNDDGTTLAIPPINAVSVEAVGRAAGFQVAWAAQGSRTRIILYSTRGASIAPGEGPLIRICYTVAPETVPQRFLVRDTETLVADAAGEAMGSCPTIRRVPPGTICVSSGGCDLNEDGVSDVLDVIRLVRCALGGGDDSTSACPDSVRAHADCNGDGSVDIRDVICCVRKIVQVPVTPRPGSTGGAPGQGNSIGFEGEVRWTGVGEGRASVRIKPGEDWGGTQFSIDPGGAAVRIRGLTLAGASSTDQIEWAIDQSGVAHAMLYTTAIGQRPTRSYVVELMIERSTSGPASGAIRLENVRFGTSSGAEAMFASVPTGASSLGGAGGRSGAPGRATESLRRGDRNRIRAPEGRAREPPCLRRRGAPRAEADRRADACGGESRQLGRNG